jgi:hypothetical protein
MGHDDGLRFFYKNQLGHGLLRMFEHSVDLTL